MTAEEVDALDVGLYVVFWKKGGRSLAAIGVGEDGQKWIAPANWVMPATGKLAASAFRHEVGRVIAVFIQKYDVVVGTGVQIEGRG